MESHRSYQINQLSLKQYSLCKFKSLRDLRRDTEIFSLCSKINPDLLNKTMTWKGVERHL